jgi:Fe(3+) dicitrate transport protein
MRFLITIGLLWGLSSWNCLAQQNFKIEGQLLDSLGQAIIDAEIFLQNNFEIQKSDKNGQFQFKQLGKGSYILKIEAKGFAGSTHQVKIKDKDLKIKLELKVLETQGPEVEVSIDNANYGMNSFRAVDWDAMVIGAAKKSELIDCDKIEGNLAANNSRQIYAKVAGLNIWENDNSGIQLNIGGRGLSPNRTSNFNTRQNGYDISADALGYPESYYIPPAQALERIEIIRGAASLQYGTQFGGMLNFKLRKGPKDSPFQFVSENTYGAFNFFNSFNSIGGSSKNGKFNYYGYFQYKRGDGWRPQSDFQAQNGYIALNFQLNKKIELSFEQTVMRYLAHQPGGLTDLEFTQNPRQSNRLRNWFKVNWNISSLSMDYHINDRTKLNIRNFALFADRQSLGNLTPINRVDYGGPRDLIKGNYNNIGNETRLLHRYNMGKAIAVALGGIRIYKGFTQQAQGYSNADSSAMRTDFLFQTDASGILRSDYQFPSFNAAAFFENYIAINDQFSITPGIRYEYIQTAANGYFQDLLVTPSAEGNDTLRNEAVYESRTRPRSIFLAGLGFSYKPKGFLELYANFSQNYRAINFNDMRIINPNQEIDPELSDESGFNADLGFRGKIKTFFRFDLSLFYLAYNNRIGNLSVARPDPENPALNQLINLRTNIGDARVLGLESLVEVDIWQLIQQQECEWGLVVYGNFSILDGRYIRSENSFALNKKLELVPPMTIRTGLTAYVKDFRFSYQLSHTAKHYTDATNAELVPNAVVGAIPAYTVMDISASYSWKWFKFQAGVNNLANTAYFTRRAAAYPGPGIIPADGRSFYFSLRTTLAAKRKS